MEETMAKELLIDDVISDYMKNEFGDKTIVTGWVLTASVSDATKGGDPNGFVYSASAGMAAHVQLGLLTSVVNDLNNVALLTFLGDSSGK
jgi:hypothetical protein